MLDKQPKPLSVADVHAELEKHLSACFIHLDGYGTRCSTVVTHSHNGEIFYQEKQFGEHGLEKNNYSTRMNSP